MARIEQRMVSRPSASTEARALARPGHPALWVHFAAIAAAALLPMLPKADGAMLLIPFVPGAPAGARWATNHGASLVGLGPLSGSFIVSGARDELIGAALADGFLLLPATMPLCATPSEPVNGSLS